MNSCLLCFKKCYRQWCLTHLVHDGCCLFCPGSKREVRESGLCSLPGVNTSKAGHTPEMCLLEHLYIEYSTSSRPRDLSRQGIKGTFPEPALSAAAHQGWGSAPWRNAALLYKSISYQCTFPIFYVWTIQLHQLFSAIKLDWSIHHGAKA